MNALRSKVAVYVLGGLIGLTSLLGEYELESPSGVPEDEAAARRSSSAPDLERAVGAVRLGLKVAKAKEMGQYQPPSLDGYRLSQVKMVDMSKPEDGVNETTYEIYKKGNESLVGRFLTNRKVWAWAVYHNLKDIHDSARNYVFVDSQCKGVFDERYGPDEEFYLPDCIGVK